MKSWNAKQLDGIMALYTEGSELLPPTGERVVGKEKIRAYFKRLFDAATTLTINLDSDKTDASGELGYDSGSYEDIVGRAGMTMSGAVTISGSVTMSGGGGQTKTRGSYLVVLKRQTGKWMIVQQAITEIIQTSTGTTIQGSSLSGAFK